MVYRQRIWATYYRPGTLVLHKDELKAYRLLGSAQKLGVWNKCRVQF